MKKIISMVLAVIMLCAVLPVSAFAGTVDTALNDVGFTVIDNDQSTLAPGVTMNELVLHNSSNQRVEMYVTTVDTTLDTVQVLANYMDKPERRLRHADPECSGRCPGGKETRAL